MTGLIGYFVIVCLSLIIVEKSKLYSKSFNYDRNDYYVIHSVRPFWKDEMVYAVCENIGVSVTELFPERSALCKVYMDTSNLDKNTVQYCDLNLKFAGRLDLDVVLLNAGDSKAIIAARDGRTKIRLVSVNLKGCRVNEASIDVSKIHDYLRNVVVIPRENNYDVVFHNNQLCRDFLCKATFDYEGKLVKAASSFPMIDLDFTSYSIQSAKNRYLVSEFCNGSTNVHLIHDEDKKTNTLLSGKRGMVSLSKEDNKLGFCAQFDRKLVCMQHDDELGNMKKIEVEMATGMKFLDAHNFLEKGLLTLAVGSEIDSSDKGTFVVRFDEQGKQVKSVNAGLKCDNCLAFFPKLYKNSNGQYCVSSLCISAADKFSRDNRCFLKAELF